MITFEDVWRKLSHKKYREQYALALLKRSVAFQIKTLRKKHCGSQAILAERSQLTQGVVSRAEDQEYGNLTFNTVGRIAAGLDIAFIGKFVPWSELAKFSRDLSEDEFANIPTFEEENAAFGVLRHGLDECAPAYDQEVLRSGAMEAAPKIGPHSEWGTISESPSSAVAAAAQAVGA
jgi:transcriptional regulator with XRE-family HTH domain